LIKANRLLKVIQAEVCYLSLIGADTDALKLIEIYSMNSIIRGIAIDKTASIDNLNIKSYAQKLSLLSQSKKTKLNLSSTFEIKLVDIPKQDGTVKTLGISKLLNRMFQKQLGLLLNPFYEAKYPEQMYGFRKGRNKYQAIACLKKILNNKTDTNSISLIQLNIETCFNKIPHEVILKHFVVPDK